MKTNLGVLNSDALNRDGYCFTVGALEDSAYDTALTGMPSLIGHDFHRPHGWIFPFAVHLQPGLSRLVGQYFYPENGDEMHQIKKGIENHLSNYYSRHCQDHLDEFKELLGALVSEEGHFYYNNCVCYIRDEVAVEAFPSLFSLRDKDGLVYVSDLLEKFDYKGCGVFVSKLNGFALFCHQYFRRNLSKVNKISTYFIDNFIALAQNTDITLRIALDCHMIGLASTYTPSAELDYCYGPYFDDKIDSIPAGVTRYISDESQKFFSGVSATDFWWKNDLSEKVLEAEEVREASSYGVSGEHFGNRYIHSIYSGEKQSFRHFDGAIRLYDEEGIMQRWDTDIKKAGKQSAYTKLFRIDGGLSLADWKRLIIFYFNGNSLIYEYFGIKDEYEALLAVPSAMSKKEEIVPYSISKDDGLRLFISYKENEREYAAFDRRFGNLDSLSFNNESFEVVELPAERFARLMREEGQELILPAEARIVNVEDKYCYFPTVEHGINDTQGLLDTTMSMFRKYFGLSENKDGISSLSLSWNESDRRVTFSLFGHNSELYKWFTQHVSIPINRKDFRNFIASQKTWLDNNYSSSIPDKINIVRPDGVQFLQRSMINPQWMDIRPSEEGIKYRVIVPEEEKELRKLSTEQNLHPAPLVLKEGVGPDAGGTLLYKWELMAFVWTDNS